jgi:hypothetical protein
LAIIQLEHAYPIDLQQENLAQPQSYPNELEAKIVSYIATWRQQARSVFIQRRNIWDDCWKLYRGEMDTSMKQDWQSKIVLPKSFTSVKMATNTIKRLLSAAKKPWDIESVNPDDLVMALRAEQMTDLTKHFMDKAYFLKEFSEGLECAFILGLGVWKLWWGLVPRKQVRVETQMVQVPSGAPQLDQQHAILGGEPTPQQATPPLGQPRFGYREQDASQYPTQLNSEYLNPLGLGGQSGAPSAPQNYISVPQKKIIQEEVLEGRLFLRAVDPYNFYWLPGSKLNRWVGTIEDVEIPRWELIKMAEAGIFPIEKVNMIQPKRIDERYKMSNLRFTETVMTQNGPNADTAVVVLTEYYGPLVWDGKIIEEYAHVVVANDNTVLLMQRNPFLHRKSPYVGFSPLNLPFRTEGVGLIEMVRFIDKALSQLANLSVDTLVFKLLPLFEVTPETLENPEDLETGMVPGKILRKNLAHVNTQAIRPVQFEDVSSGSTQVWAGLDRSHQEGALISDIAEGLPRFRGAQTATETQQLAQQSESFMGGMAADIEKEALEPMVTMAMDLIFQFLDTANDPRVASILGVGAESLKGMSREDVFELVAGDYEVKVSGITGQIMKSEMLQNLVQFMNLIGQNPQAWLPYINEDALLRRILEAFRPHIHDIEEIISDPATADAKKVAAASQELLPQMLQAIAQGQPAPNPPPQLDPNQLMEHGLALQQMTHDKELQQMSNQQTAAQQVHEQGMQQSDQQHQQQMQQMKQPPYQPAGTRPQGGQ